MLFQSFFPQNISLLPKIVTEVHANLKKKKTSCNTTLKHNILMQSWSSTPLWNVRVFTVWFASRWHLFPIYSSSIHHQSSYAWAVVHYCIVHIFPRHSIIVWTKRRPGSGTRASCSMEYSIRVQWPKAVDMKYKNCHWSLKFMEAFGWQAA